MGSGLLRTLHLLITGLLSPDTGGSGGGSSRAEFERFLSGKPGPAAEQKGELEITRDMSSFTRRKDLGDYELTRNWQQLAVSFLRFPFIHRDYWYNVFRVIWDMVRDWDREKQHLFFELFPFLNLAPGPLRLDLTAQVKALVGRIHQYHIWSGFLFAKIGEWLTWISMRNLDTSTRCDSRLKFNTLRAMCERLNGYPFMQEWIDYLISEMVIGVKRRPRSGLTLVMPMWLGPNDTYGGMPQLSGDVNAGVLGSLFPRIPTLEEMNGDASAFNPMTEVVDEGGGSFSLVHRAFSTNQGDHYDFGSVIPNSNYQYGLIAEHLFSQVQALILAFDAEFRADFKPVNSELVGFYTEKLGLLNARFNLAEFSQRFRSMRPIDSDGYEEQYMRLFDDVPQPVLRAQPADRTYDEFYLPPNLLFPKLNSSGEVDLTQMHYEMSTEEYLDFCASGGEEAEHPEYVWPNCAELPYVSCQIAEAEQPDMETYNTFLKTFPDGDDFAEAQFGGVNDLFGSLSSSSPAKPSDYFRPYGKYAIARNFKMMSNIGDRFVRKEKEIEARLKSDGNWFMYRRDYDQYHVLRPMWKMSPVKDPMDPMLCGYFLVLTKENAEIAGTWENWYKYHSRLRNGYGSLSVTVGGSTIADLTAGNLGTTQALAAVSAQFGNLWHFFHDQIMDGLLFVGDAAEEIPIQAMTREDVAPVGVSFPVKASYYGKVPGSPLPWKPIQSATDHANARYAEGSFPIVGAPLSAEPYGNHSVVIGPSVVVYSFVSWVNIILNNWGWLDGGAPGDDASLIAKIWPDLPKQEGTLYLRQNVDLLTKIFSSWTPSSAWSLFRPHLETQFELPYEGFKRVLDFQKPYDQKSMLTSMLNPPNVTSARIDQAVRLILKIQETTDRKETDTMSGARYSDPTLKKRGQGRPRNSGKSDFRGKGRRGRRPKKPWDKPKTESFDDKLKRDMGESAPVKDERPEFPPESLDSKGVNEKV